MRGCDCRSLDFPVERPRREASSFGMTLSVAHDFNIATPADCGTRP